ncbi:LysR family transcriptional regulator [Bacillus sp. FJAT-49705]|uniref:LysR family transcriptional regulator n=1 Tax=Cytobacillus citreus TaxID=2833586 RepID=A0ABS5NWZ8_9BACI|nr:LysR family transcriptional regulator [Cytobacillus citreus]MBS4192358.1 LysR family transcriptional regulator [Cytobacillus citreus]
MEIRNLKTFQVVAEELNMTRAAKKLKYTQPTITLQIQSLEKELNHTLLTRVGKKTMLTTAGKKLIGHVDKLFTLIDEMETDMEALHGPSGVLTIAASEYYCRQHLSPIVRAYTEMYPDVKISLLPLNSVHAIQSVRDQVADIAIIASECNEIDIRKNFLEEEQTFLVVSSEISKERSFHEIISQYAFISYNDDCSFSNIIDKHFKKSILKPHSTIMVGGSDEMIKRAVLNGTGYAILGENVIKNEIKDGSITILQQVSQPIITSAVNLKIRSEEPNIQTFHEFLQNAWPVRNNHTQSQDFNHKEIVTDLLLK